MNVLCSSLVSRTLIKACFTWFPCVCVCSDCMPGGLHASVWTSTQSLCHNMVSGSVSALLSCLVDVRACSLLFSLGALYFINKISTSVYSLSNKGSGVKYQPGKGKSHR